MATIQMFRDTGSAYDCSQCGENLDAAPVGEDEHGWGVGPAVNTGDVIVVESEQVVGLVHTWPIAVTANAGKLHSLRAPSREAAIDFLVSGEYDKLSFDAAVAAVDAAIAEATKRGWPLWTKES